MLTVQGKTFRFAPLDALKRAPDRGVRGFEIAMLGDTYIPWLSLFAGIVTYKIGEDGQPDNNEGFINIDEYIRIFEQRKLSLGGTPYEKDADREEELVEAIIHNAGVLCQLGLMERKRGILGARLEYRVTTKGRKLDALSLSKFGLFRCKLFFLSRCLWQRIKKYKILITGAAFGMAIVNAARFYNLAFTWASEAMLAFATVVSLVGILVWAAYAGS